MTTGRRHTWAPVIIARISPLTLFRTEVIAKTDLKRWICATTPQPPRRQREGVGAALTPRLFDRVLWTTMRFVIRPFGKLL